MSAKPAAPAAGKPAAPKSPTAAKPAAPAAAKPAATKPAAPAAAKPAAPAAAKPAASSPAASSAAKPTVSKPGPASKSPLRGATKPAPAPARRASDSAAASGSSSARRASDTAKPTAAGAPASTGAAAAAAASAKAHKSKYSKSDVLALKNVFCSIDENGSGFVSTQEFFAQLKKEGSHLAEFAQDLIEHSDKNQDGKLSVEETLSILYPYANQRDRFIMLRWWNPPKPKAPPPPPPQLSTEQKLEIRSIFSVYDKDKDGMLTTEELLDGLKNIMPAGEVQDMFDRYDVDGSKTISPEEFETMMFEGYMGAAK